MHGTALSRTQGRTRSTNSRGSLRARTLKDRLAGHRTTRYRTAGYRTARRRTYPSDRRPGWCSRRRRTRRRSLVHGPRPGLRDDHARRRRRWGHGNWRCGRTRRYGRGWGRRGGRSGNRWRRRRSRRNHRSRWGGGYNRARRHSNWRWGNNDRSWLVDHRWRYNMPHRGGGRSWRRHGRCRRRRQRRRWFRGSWRHDDWLRWRWRCNRTYGRWRRSGFFLLRDRLQHVARTRDVRQINLGLNFFFSAQRTRGARRRRLPIGRAADVDSNFFRFVLLQRTGMRFLLGDAHQRQRIENGFALDFQLPGEIVDSNLTHPAFLLRVWLMSSSRPHGVSAFCTRTGSNSLRVS